MYRDYQEDKAQKISKNQVFPYRIIRFLHSSANIVITQYFEGLGWISYICMLVL